MHYFLHFGRPIHESAFPHCTEFTNNPAYGGLRPPHKKNQRGLCPMHLAGDTALCVSASTTFWICHWLDSTDQSLIIRLYRVSQKSEPVNILQQQPQICTDLNKILHTQDDICCKHYCIVSYKSALTLLKYEFLNNITHKSWVSIAVDASHSEQSKNVHSSKRLVSSRKFSH